MAKAWLNRVLVWATENLIWILLVAAVIGFSLGTPKFLQPNNLVQIFARSAPLGLLVIGQAFTMITGNFDLSSESTFAFTAVVASMLLVPKANNGLGLMLPVPLVIILMLLLGALIGLTNGLLITKLKMNNFITTVAMLMIVRGATYLVSRGDTVNHLPDSFLWLGGGNLFATRLSTGGRLGVPACMIFLILAFAIADGVTRYRRFGRNMYTLGGNRAAAEAAGIRSERMIVAVYVISGFCAAVAGWLLTGRLASATTGMGAGWIFYIQAAAVLGGVSLFGGRGAMTGAFGGVLLWGVLDTGLNLLMISPFAIDAVRGALLLLAIFIDAMKVRYQRRLAIQMALAGNPIGLEAPITY